MRTPSSALPACPQGFVLGAGRPFVTAAAFFGAALALAADFFATTFAGLRAALFAGCAAAFFDLDLFAMVAPYFLRSALCGLRLPMRPLSVPAAGSITALMRVGLPESMAASTARLSSSGVVA